MATGPGSQTLRYLLVEVASQTFVIPMDNVTAVHLLTDGQVDTPLSVPDESAMMQAIVLAGLFWGTGRTSDPVYAVVITAQTGICAIAVDAVRPVSAAVADDCFPLPPLIAVLNLPFTGVIRQPGDLTLIIDPPRLIEWVRRISPDLVMEHSHAV